MARVIGPRLTCLSGRLGDQRYLREGRRHQVVASVVGIGGAGNARITLVATTLARALQSQWVRHRPVSCAVWLKAFKAQKPSRG